MKPVTGLMLRGTAGLLFAALAPVPATVVATDNGQAIIEESKRRSEAVTEQTDYRLELTDENGGLRERALAIYFKRFPDRNATLLKFTSPANVAGTGLLVEDHVSTVDIWNYLPAARRIRRISGQQKRNWFMGTELTYEDFEGYDIPSYSFTLVRTEVGVECRPCFVVEARPKTDDKRKSTGYSRLVYWIDQEHYYPVRTERFDSDGRLWKVISAEGVRAVGRYFRPRLQTIVNSQNKRTNRLIEVTRRIDQPLEDYYVSQRFLRTE